MTVPKDEPTVTGRVRNYRQRMRDRGMRPIQLWVTDVRAPEFTAEAHQQSLAVATSERAADDQAYIDALSLENE